MTRTIITMRVLLLALVLAGCTHALWGAGGLAVYNLFQDPEVNLTQKGNAAADILNYRGNAYLRPSFTHIVAKPLENRLQPGFYNDFSSNLILHVGERLRYLGYPVDMTSVSSAGINKTPISNPHIILSGDYTFRLEDLEVDVSLYLVKISNGRPVAQFDFTLPVTTEMRRDLETKPRIYRVTDPKPSSDSDI